MCTARSASFGQNTTGTTKIPTHFCWSRAMFAALIGEPMLVQKVSAGKSGCGRPGRRALDSKLDHADIRREKKPQLQAEVIAREGANTTKTTDLLTRISVVQLTSSSLSLSPILLSSSNFSSSSATRGSESLSERFEPGPSGRFSCSHRRRKFQRDKYSGGERTRESGPYPLQTKRHTGWH